MRRRLAFAAAIVGALSPSAEAGRDGAAVYDLSISGLPIGEARLSAARGGGRYVVEAAFEAGFLVWGRSGSGRSEGRAGPDGLIPERYAVRWTGGDRPGFQEILFEDGRVARVERDPPPEADWYENRVPLEDAHLAGVLDPLSAAVVAAPVDASPEAVCRRAHPVFTGFTRLDLMFEGVRTAADGALDCVVRYQPVAGHRADSGMVERLMEPGAFSVSLSRLSPGLWAPSRVAIETRYGPFEMVRRD